MRVVFSNVERESPILISEIDQITISGDDEIACRTCSDGSGSVTYHKIRELKKNITGNGSYRIVCPNTVRTLLRPRDGER